MVSAIFSEIGNAISAFATALSSAVTSVTDMFYTTGEGGGLTVLGTLILIAVGVGLVYWAFNLIRGLIAQRRA